VARGGFFRRIINAVREAFTPTPAPPPPPERPERPARDEDFYRQAWQQETLTRAGRSYRRHRELFESIPGIEDEDPDEQEYLWRSYIENMVKGRHRRNDPSNPWWGIIGLDPRDFDWDDWRTAMGYKSRRK
jgi:hypothetical protein